HVHRPKVWPRRVRSQQSPRWSAERRTSRVMGREAPRKRLRAYVTRPPTGAAAPERLSALRSLTVCGEGKTANLGGPMPRENDDARASARSAFRTRWGALGLGAHPQRVLLRQHLPQIGDIGGGLIRRQIGARDRLSF